MPVYMLQAGAFGDIKIGVATDPLARMRQLQTSMPKKLRLVRVLEGGADDEKVLHRRFAADRLTGEWFRPSVAMLAEDIGLPDLPIPRGKRAPHRDPATARGRWCDLRSDLFELIGGSIVLAKALGVPPWLVHDYGVHEEHLSALVALARNAGAPVGYREVRDLMRAADAEAKQDSETRYWNDRRKTEAQWLEKNGGPDKAWWPLDPVNAAPADPEPEGRSA